MAERQGPRSVANMVIVLMLALLIGGTAASIYEMVAYTLATAT